MRWHFAGVVVYEDLYGGKWSTQYCFFSKPEFMKTALQQPNQDDGIIGPEGFSICNQWNEIT